MGRVKASKLVKDKFTKGNAQNQPQQLKVYLQITVHYFVNNVLDLKHWFHHQFGFIFFF